MRTFLTKVRGYVLLVPKPIRTVVAGFVFCFFFFGGFFIATQQDIPYTSELMFVEYSGSGGVVGSVVPASCESLGADHTGWGCPTFSASSYSIAYGASTNLYANLPQAGVWLFCTINGVTVWYYPSWYYYPLNSGALYSTTGMSMNCQNPSYGWNESWSLTVTVAAPATCPLPWGGTLAHAGSVTAYQSSSVDAPASCVSESRTCTNGSLSGSYTNQSCTVVTNGSCSATMNTCSLGNFSDTADSSTQYLWSCTGINGGSTANCTVNRPSIISTDSAQTFVYGQSATAISPITITDATSPVITAANDIRIKIATSSVHMLWDTTDTTASISGTGSGKVSTSVTYEGGGSVLVIPVNTNFSASDAIVVSGLSYTSFTAVNTATTALRMYLDGASDTTADDSGAVGTVGISGGLTIEDHTLGQVTDAFDATNETSEELFAFKLTPAGENISVTSLVFGLQGVKGISTGNITNAGLYRDVDVDKTYDAGGDTAVGGSGSVAVSGDTGTITFSTPISVTAASDYLLVSDVASLSGSDALGVRLIASNVVTSGVTTALPITGVGIPTAIQHRKSNLGGGGSSAAIGVAAPSGDGVTTGGDVGSGDGGGFIDSDTGDSLGNEPGFEVPTGTSGTWTSGSNAYASDGSYTTAASSVTQTYSNFGFSVPTNNQINGIEVKLEASASTPAGTISVRLSWDNGNSDTALLTTATLTATDAVYALGGPTYTWGRSWSASEFNNGNFVIEVVGNPSSNTVRIDAIQVRVYHQSTGGGGGGGGAVFKDPENHFATVYLAVKDMWVNVFRRFFTWLMW